MEKTEKEQQGGAYEKKTSHQYPGSACHFDRLLRVVISHNQQLPDTKKQHLCQGTSLPIGGSSTHSVLTGHRGLPTLDLFSDLDQLVQGDVFYVKVLGETMAYQVDSIQTVLPQETECLRVFEGQDYVTLVTCTPYAVNTHRLLVRGVRIPYEEAAQVAPDEVQSKVWIPMEVKAMLAVLAILILIYVVYRVRRKKKR